MFGGAGGMNPRKMKQMMQQMGIEVEEIDAEEVIIRTKEEALHFDAPDVTRMDARGQSTYQIVGEAQSKAAKDEPKELETDSAGGIPDSDIEIVSSRTGASPDDAKSALEATDGDLAAAIERLE